VCLSAGNGSLIFAKKRDISSTRSLSLSLSLSLPLVLSVHHLCIFQAANGAKTTRYVIIEMKRSARVVRSLRGVDATAMIDNEELSSSR